MTVESITSRDEGRALEMEPEYGPNDDVAGQERLVGEEVADGCDG